MDSEILIWYKKPAENFNEALPIGNGRIGLHTACRELAVERFVFLVT